MMTPQQLQQIQAQQQSAAAGNVVTGGAQVPTATTIIAKATTKHSK